MYAAVLDAPEWGDVPGLRAMHLVHQRALDQRATVNLRAHAELLHALELRVRDLIDVRERPAQALDGTDSVDRLVLIEEGIDRRFHLNVRIDVEALRGKRL